MLKELVDNSLVKILKVKFGRDFANGRSDCADVLTHYEQLQQYWMVIFWTLEASVGRTSSKRFPPTSASAAPSTSTQRWRRRCMQGEGIRRRQYLAFKGWSRSWSRRRVRRRGWRCWRWRRARLALTWDSRSFCTFIFFILSKMLNVCMDERLSADNLALASSELIVYWSHSRQNWKFEMPSFMLRKPYETQSRDASEISPLSCRVSNTTPVSRHWAFKSRWRLTAIATRLALQLSTQMGMHSRWTLSNTRSCFYFLYSLNFSKSLYFFVYFVPLKFEFPFLWYASNSQASTPLSSLEISVELVEECISFL